MTCDFTSFLTVFQSYQDDGRFPSINVSFQKHLFLVYEIRPSLQKADRREVNSNIS